MHNFSVLSVGHPCWQKLAGFLVREPMMTVVSMARLYTFGKQYPTPSVTVLNPSFIHLICVGPYLFFPLHVIQPLSLRRDILWNETPPDATTLREKTPWQSRKTNRIIDDHFSCLLQSHGALCLLDDCSSVCLVKLMRNMLQSQSTDLLSSTAMLSFIQS